MNRAMMAAASGMAAQQHALDVVADNLANADVVGFKSAEATFAQMGGGALLGTASTGTRELFTSGKLMKSGGPFDIAIDGAGFFTIDRDGERGYTRAGSFTRSADGSLRNADGWKFRGVNVPESARDISVAANGSVTALIGDAPGKRVSCGTIALCAFDAPEKLRSLGSAMFAASDGSGRAHALHLGGEHDPKIVFGSLEKSNVSVVESMMAILAAQRAYEANSKGVQAADEMLRIANNIHRS